MPQAFRIKTDAFSATDLLLESFSCSEALSTLTEISATLLSPRSDLDINEILGKPVTFEIELRSDAKRHLHGFVSRFALTGASGRFHRYQAVVRPWLWFLTRTTDCRIFQDMKVPDIIKTVFDDHPIAVHDFKLFREYRKWDYCVQYRESDFNFVSRLLEHEGIYYRFDHSDGQHKLILLDSVGAHDPQPDGADDLPFFSAGQQPPPDLDFVSRWAVTRSVQPGKFAIKDFDFEIPPSDLFVEGEQQRNNDLSDFEAFDYPGGFTKTPDGVHYLENRRDEAQSRFEVFSGATNAQSVSAGFTFNLRRHPRADQNAEYLVTGTDIQASNGSFDAGGGAAADFHCEISALLATQQFRPLRRARKGRVHGPQTAVVVGKEGDEIHTDKFGRVRVQFHWDRLGKKNEKSSCMVRVAQVWAGKNFGAMFIPRVGHEVIVDFLEGDPDQPIITGCVYNGDNMPPWKLPDNATQSGFLSRSSKGGVVANANMIQFEDKKGAEALTLHAERNMSTSVEADQSTSVGHDRSVSVKHHDSLTVDHGRSVTVAADGETYSVTGKRVYTVTGEEYRHITSHHQKNVDGNTKEFTNGTRLCWTAGSFTSSADRAFHNAGPEYFLQAFDVKTKATGNMFLESAGPINMKASEFKFSATGNINFTGNNFNRTIFQGNDTVLGPNTNTYIGVSRSTKMGPSTDVYSGLSNSTKAGIAIDSFMGMQVSNCLALTMSNAVSIAIQNAALSLGMTALNLTMSGLSLDNNAIKLLNGGGASGPGAAASLSAGPGIAAVMAAAVGGGFAAVFGGALALDARAQGEADRDKLLNDPSLTPAVKARLQAVLDSRFSNPTAEGYEASIPAAEIAAQTGQLAQDTPGATPSGDPFGSGSH
jgi:type VI secretion system secreted protein VgrG